MYDVTVPVMSDVFCEAKENYVAQFEKIKAKRVLLVIDCYQKDSVKRQKILKTVRENAAFLHENGFEVGVWLWAFMVPNDQQYVHITSPEGRVSKNEVCPSDNAFVAFAAAYIGEVAQCGADMILFDDDYRYGFHDCGLGCACQNHRRYISDLLGEDVTEKDLTKTVFAGGKNRYRSAFIQANAYFLERFAREMRAAVDRVNPTVRIGLCACMDVWDFDGIDPYQICRLLAGNTQPYLRLIGAPYWAVKRGWGNRLQDVIDLTRMERHWCGDGVEIVSEGDVYPRPRYACPASYLELYDLNLRVFGQLDGIQKYTFDYCGNDRYETGYNEAHLRHEPLYAAVSHLFDGKKSVGVCVYEYQKKFENAVIPAEAEGTSAVQDLFFSPASRMLSASGIPLLYGADGAFSVVFGENARYVPLTELKNAVIDLRAAEILKERGVDVGLIDGKGVLAPVTEKYVRYGQSVRAMGVKACRVTPAEGATVESEWVAEDERAVASYTYRNAVGQKFLVLALYAYYNHESFYRNYGRARQLTDVAQRFFKVELPAYAVGNPDVYLQCKEKDSALAVSVSNCSADHLYDLKVVLGRSPHSVTFVNCEGILEGNTVTLRYLPPFDFAAFEVCE